MPHCSPDRGRSGPAILPATALPTYLQDQWKLVNVEGLPKRRVGVAKARRNYPSAPARALTEVLFEIVSTAAELHPGLHPYFLVPDAQKAGQLLASLR